MVRAALQRLPACPRGQVMSEYGGVVAVIVCGVLAAWYLLVPPLVSGFMDLARRIIEMNP